MHSSRLLLPWDCTSEITLLSTCALPCQPAASVPGWHGGRWAEEADWLRNESLAARLHQGCRNVQAGSSILKTLQKICRWTQYSPVKWHRLLFKSQLMQVAALWADTAQPHGLTLRAAAAPLMWHRGFGWAAAWQLHSRDSLLMWCSSRQVLLLYFF